MDELKAKTIGAAKWSALDKVINIVFEFSVGIILARLLLPSDFGTIAIILVIISFSLIFVDSGFNQSLIRDPEVEDADFSTIFIFNFIIGLVVYILLFLFSPQIALFYDKPELALYIRVLGVSIIISSLTFVQRVKLAREINFKEISKVNITASLISGVIAIILAFSSYGIWSLITKSILRELVQSFLFWVRGKWIPSSIFSIKILQRHFKYGSNFLISSIIGQVYNNLLAITIGKIYTLQTLGFYNRAQLFSNTVTTNIASIITTVSFSALAKVQNDRDKFVQGVRLLLNQAFYVIGFLMIVVFFTSKAFIPILLGDQWIEASVYLQYLTIIGFFGVLNSILINSISVTGKSKIYLYFQMWALFLNIIVLVIGYFYGIENMLRLLILFYITSYILISKVFSFFFSYSLLMQLRDFKKIIYLFIILIVFGFLSSVIFESGVLQLLVQGLVFFFLTIIYSHYFKIEEFLNIKSLIFKKRKAS